MGQEDCSAVLNELKRIEEKLNRAGVSFLADLNISSTMQDLLNLLMEPKVIGLIDNLVKILNALSMINPSILASLSLLAGCLSNIDLGNIPEASLTDLVRELSRPEAKRLMGLILMLMREAGKCMGGGND